VPVFLYAVDSKIDLSTVPTLFNADLSLLRLSALLAPLSNVSLLALFHSVLPPNGVLVGHVKRTRRVHAEKALYGVHIPVPTNRTLLTHSHLYRLRRSQL
jgi:hypothetical protein